MWLFIGILIGIVLSPILEALLYFVISYKKPKPVVQNSVNIPTARQAKQLFDSTHTCTDIAWFNVYIQRYFLELSQSYAYKDKLKRNMLKKLKAYEKYITVDIESIDVGKEAPMFSSVKVLTKKMLEELVQEKNGNMTKICENLESGKQKTKDDEDINDYESTSNIDEESSFDDEFLETINEYKKEVEKNDYEPENSLKVKNDKIDKPFETENNTCVDKHKNYIKHKNDGDVEILSYEINTNNTLSSFSTSSTIENSKDNKAKKIEPKKEKTNISEYDQVDFNNVTLLFDMEYKGTIKIKINVKLSKKINIPASFTLNYLKGPVLVRLPALLNHTRQEFSILNIEKLEFKLDSDISNKYLKKTATNFLHNVFIRMFKKTYVFPRFYSQYLPNVTPSMREVIYKYDHIDTDESAQNCLKDLMLVMMMDYKVTKVEKDIVYRTGNYFVNGTNRKVKMNEINIKDFLIRMEDKKYKNRKNNKKEDKKIYFNKDKKMLIKTERIVDHKFSKYFIQNNIAHLTILEDVVNSYIGIQDIKNYMKYDKLTLKFDNINYKFVRLMYEDCVIFQSDESNEFFSFRLRNMEVLEVFYYATNKHFIFDETKMRRLKGKLQQKIEYQDLNIYNEQNQSVCNVEETCDKSNVIKGFIDYIKNRNDKQESYKIKEIKLNLTESEALHCLATNQRLRCMLYFDTFEVKQNNSSENQNNSDVPRNKNLKNIYTVIDSKYIIDVIDDKIITGFLFTTNKNEQALLKIVHIDNFKPSLLNNFICYLGIEERLLKCRKGLIMFEHTDVKRKKFDKTYKIEKGFIYIEVYTNPEDEIYFYVYNKTAVKYEIEQVKLVGQKGKKEKINVFAFGVIEKASISIYLHAKFGMLNNNIRIYTNPEEMYFNDFYMNAYVELNKKCKYKKILNHKKRNSLFWDIENENIQSSLVCNKMPDYLAGTGTIMLNDEKTSITMQNKTKAKIRYHLKMGVVDLQL